MIQWRRVETISPDAYVDLMDWVHAHSAEGEVWPCLTAMTTNEVTIDPAAAIAELGRVLRGQPPEPIREQATLLRDLIWEAGDPNSNWLNWRPCQICGRRWVTVAYHGHLVCVGHANPAALIAYLKDEMSRFPGMIDNTSQITALQALPPPPPFESRPAPATAPAAPASEPAEHTHEAQVIDPAAD